MTKIRNEYAELFEKSVLKEGEGARGYFIATLESLTSHAVVWEVENGEVWIRDCQNNKKMKPIDIIQYCLVFQYFRTDNLTQNEKCLEAISNNTKKRG